MEASMARKLPRSPDNMSRPTSPARDRSIPAVTTGDVTPASPFSLPVAAVQVKIGGVLANVQFAGLAPGLTDGLLQMNIQIPDVPAGELPFDVSVGGVAAATTTISIAAKQ